MKTSIFLNIFLLAVSAQARIEVFDDIMVAKEEPSLDEMWGQLWPFQGISTFAHLGSEQCLTNRDLEYDIAVIGVPFDTAVSYRPGSRFGPRAIRAASQRQTSLRGYNPRGEINPYLSWAKIYDCGDIPVLPMDNNLAFKQMNLAFEELLLKHSAPKSGKSPQYIALGGDHSILLPHMRALHKVYGKLNVVHFDAHLDTWKPDKYPSFWHTPQSEVNHGLMLWKAFNEGLTSNHNVHAGLRTKLSGVEDWQDDEEQNFQRITADDIWLRGPQYVIDRILETVPADTPTYLSVDIDVLDPAFASGTGTQEPGGWLPRELIHVLRGIENLLIVGADIVEVNPDFDHAEVTSTNGAQVVYEILTSMVKKGPLNFETKLSEPTRFVKTRASENVALQSLKEIEDLKAKLEDEILRVKNLVRELESGKTAF